MGAAHTAAIATDHSTVPIIGHRIGPPRDKPRIASTARLIGWGSTPGWSQSGYWSSGTNPVQKKTSNVIRTPVAWTRVVLTKYSAIVTTIVANAIPNTAGTSNHPATAHNPW